MFKIERIKANERRKFLHIEISFLIFRFSFFHMRGKYTIRFEISSNNW